jgi:inner membrane protein
VDPICHTLTGAALGCTGLEKRSRFGRSTLIIGANLPDIDAVTYLLDGVESLAIRRGITHGLPAVIILPLLLATAMKGLDLLRDRAAEKQPAGFGQLFLLAMIAIATHPVLDFLNNYGMRWLMPFVDSWTYGDTLFIIDPLVWLILLPGVYFAARMNTAKLSLWRQPAAIALAITAVYILLSAGLTVMARQATFTALRHDPPQRLMTSPVFLRPFERRLVLEYEKEYRVGTIHLLPTRSVDLDTLRVSKGQPRDLELAATTQHGSIFLHWARFPFTESEIAGETRVIRIMDARYVREWEEDDFATVRVELPRQ